ncbi:MAG: ParA family protein [Deltaproteobacteria bacterium]|jgi:chromosome partitioning protein|nr:ParA family protein [Deltaproteobacteria bacterium]
MAPYCVIAIINQKGGVGKTTTAINLSACLGYFGFKTLLIDADPQSNSTIGVGVQPEDYNYTFYNYLLGNYNLSDVVIKTKFTGLYLLPTNDDLYAADIDLSKIGDDNYNTLASKMGNQISEYDFIVFDSPPHLGPLTLNIMKASDTLLVPLKADFLALQGIAILMKTLDRIKINLNAKINLKGVVLTMFNQSTNLCKEVEQSVKEVLGDIVFDTKINQNVTLAEAPSFGKPVIYYNFKSSGSENYRLLTAEFLKRMKIAKRDS